MPSFSAKTGRPAYDSRQLQRIFDRRAATFREVAFLPREIAQRMHERLDYIKLAVTQALDAGCALGDDLPHLHQRFPNASIFGVDLSLAMLGQAARQDAPAQAGPGWRRFLPAAIGKTFGRYGHGPRLAQADFSVLPFASAAFGLLWSNLALHWHPRPDLVLAEWQRVLKVDGLLMFSTLGPDTLKELRCAYADAEAAHGVAPRTHIVDFVDMHDLGDMLIENGFGMPVMDQETLTVTYPSPARLLADVRRWGAYPFMRDDDDHNHTHHAHHALAMREARRLYDTLLQTLDAQRRADGTIALTFEVIYGHAWKTAPQTTPEGYGIVRIEDIGRKTPENR